MIKLFLDKARDRAAKAAVDFIASKFLGSREAHAAERARLEAEVTDLRAQILELEIAGTRVCDELVTIEGVIPPWLLKCEADALKSLRDLLRERAFRAAPRATPYPYF